MSFRAAILGCGRMGCGTSSDVAGASINTHAAAFAAHPSTDLVAICDVDAARARACAERWSVPRWYADPSEMLRDATPQIVSIATPDDTHAAMLALVLSATDIRGVLLEKPVALHASEALEARRLTARAGVTVAVNYTRRYMASHIALKETLVNGGLGEVQCVTGYYTKGTFHNGTHWIDLARFLFGEVTEVFGFPGASGPAGDPSFDVRLAFEAGVRASLVACDASAFSIFEMDIIGTRGRVRLVDSGLTVETSGVGPSLVHEGYTVLEPPTMSRAGHQDPTLHVVGDLVESILASRPPRCSIEDGVRSVLIADAIGQSVRVGHAVRVS
jgi:predicted dehydrogenase